MARTVVQKFDREVPLPSYGVPLWPELDASDDAPAYVAISRVAPPDGFLGRSDTPNVTEEWIRDNYGGGLYDLRLCTGKDTQLGQPRRIKIAGEPLRMSESSGREQDRAVVQASAAGQDASAIALQSRMFREHLDMIRVEAEAARERARLDIEMRMKEARAEATAERERERERHEQSMERERQRTEAQRAEQERARQADDARNKEFMALVLAMQEKQTGVMVAALNAQRQTSDPLDVVTRLLPLFDRQAEDPASRAWGVVQQGLQLAAQTAGSRPTPGIAPGAAPAARLPSGPAAPGPAVAHKGPNPAAEQAPADLKTSLAGLLQKLRAAGVDPATIVGKLESGELTIVEAEWAQEAQEAIDELNERDGSDGRRTADLDDGRRQDQPATDGAAVVANPREHGGSPSEGAPGQPNGALPGDAA